ncbi:MAG: hypothetical protein Q9211_003782, partial [Gyalolechia sp. 1 TL-2023]
NQDEALLKDMLYADGFFLKRDVVKDYGERQEMKGKSTALNALGDTPFAFCYAQALERRPTGTGGRSPHQTLRCLTFQVHDKLNGISVWIQRRREANLPSADPSESSLDFTVTSWLSRTEDPTPQKSLKRTHTASSLSSTPECGWGDSEEEISAMEVPPSASPANLSTPTSSVRANRAPIKIDPTRPSWIRERMAGHGLIFDDSDDSDALIRYPKLRDKIEEIMGWDLSSPPNEHSVKTYKYRKNEYRTDNERTWIRQMMPMLVPEAHGVLLPGHKDLSEPKNFKVETWESHGLKVITETDFHRTALPNGYMEMGFDQELAKAFTREDGLSNPRPDECYGFTTRRFITPNDPLWTKETMGLLQIAPRMHHPFMLVEGKGATGNPIDAENEAQRDGACLVTAGQILYDDIGEPAPMGADLRTMVFSVTLGVDTCKVWANWAEKLGSKHVNIHMTRVRTVALDADDALGMIRRHLHNVIHWGLIHRLPDLEAFHKKLRAVEPTFWKELQERAKKEQDEKANKKRKK